MSLEEKIVAYGDARAVLESATTAIAVSKSMGATTGELFERLIKIQQNAKSDVDVAWEECKRSIEVYDTKIF